MNAIPVRVEGNVMPLRTADRALIEFRGVEKRFHVDGTWRTAVEQG